MKNQTFPIIVLIGLSIVFGIVSIVVYFTRGKNHFFLKKKLVIGATIITLTSIASCIRPPFVSCYKVAAPDPIIEYSESSNNSSILIDDGNRHLVFNCDRMYYGSVCFKILQGEQEIQVENCIMGNDSLGNVNDLTVSLKEDIAEGRYHLKLYYGNKSDLTTASETFKSYKLVIKK